LTRILDISSSGSQAGVLAAGEDTAGAQGQGRSVGRRMEPGSRLIL